MNDQSEAPRLWARAGETVTCLNGHPICDVAHDIADDERHSPAHYTNWRQPEPDRNTHVTAIRCAECRGVWVRFGKAASGQTVYQLHFQNGWR